MKPTHDIIILYSATNTIPSEYEKSMRKKKHAHAHTNPTAMKTKFSADYITAN